MMDFYETDSEEECQDYQEEYIDHSKNFMPAQKVRLNDRRQVVSESPKEERLRRRRPTPQQEDVPMAQVPQLPQVRPTPVQAPAQAKHSPKY